VICSSAAPAPASDLVKERRKRSLAKHAHIMLLLSVTPIIKVSKELVV